MTARVAIPADMAVSSRFSDFNILDIDYKEVNGTPIPASILIPKACEQGRHAVLVRWHGGCLITGHRMYPEWFGTWVLKLAISNKAIIISPDYRLMPEANGMAILQDVRDFYNWLATPSNLDSYLPEGVSGDIDHLLVTGESAGGWLALQSALFAASKKRISGIIAHYPIIDSLLFYYMRDSHYTGDFEKQLFTPVAPQLPRSILREYLADLKGDEVVTSAVLPDRVPLVVSSLQQGSFGKLLGDDSSLYPLEMLDTVTDLPPTWLLHGKDDTVIPVEGSYKYEKKLRKRLPAAKLHVSYEPGDHGFDNDPTISMETDWVKKGVAFMQDFWPKC